MMLIRARCGAQSGPTPRAQRSSVWPKWNIDILTQNAASRTRFFQVQAIKTGHFSVIYRQIGDLLSVEQHRHKTALHKQKALTPMFQSSNFSTVCESWLQCIASAMQGLPTLQTHPCWIGNSIISELKLDHCKSTRIKHQSEFYAHWVIRVVGPNLEIPFCTQLCSVEVEVVFGSRALATSGWQ